MRRWTALVVAVAAALTLASCSMTAAPRVSGFTASPATIASGSSATLTWSVAGGTPTTLTIDQGVGDVAGLDHVSVHPTTTTTYTLTASNGSGRATAHATVTVAAAGAPTIASFMANPVSIASGGTATLSWTVDGPGPTTLAIDHGVGDVTGKTSVTVAPAQTTIYTLTATNATGQVSASATVTVGTSPPASYTLSLTGTNGQVSVDGVTQTLPYSHDFVDGSAVTLKALPASGYTFDHWSGDLTGTLNPATITIDSAKAVAASFTAVPTDTQNPTVTVTSPTNGASVTSDTINVAGTASDNVGVQAVQTRLNGGGLDGCVGTTSFTCPVGPLSQGANTITVVASDAAGNTASATVTVTYTPSGQADPFNITLDFAAPVSSTQLAAFQSAAARWAQVITQGLPDVTTTIAAGSCSGLPLSTFSGTIDDILIDVQVGPIDGPGGTLGMGGPCLLRSSGHHLPFFGIMKFDSADLSQLESAGLLQATILHEMGHVLGFGTVWGSLLTGAGTTDPLFVGANAVREWQALGGSGDVPVENCLDANGQPITGCGSGTRDAHWREAVFGDELMTGYLNTGPDPLSRVTIGSLADLGYTVDYAAADPYSLPSGVTGQALTSATHLRFDLITPTGSVP